MGVVTGFESQRKAEDFETLWQNTIKKEQDSNNYQLDGNAKLHLFIPCYFRGPSPENNTLFGQI